jgi:hypothetical protein
MGWLVALVGVAALIAIGVGLSRASELFVLRVERGKVRVVRGRIPQGLLNDVSDVVIKPPRSARVRVLVRDGSPRVEPSGDLTPEQVQRLRNTISLWPVAKIKNAPRRR